MAGEVSVERAAMNKAAGQLNEAFSVVTALRQQLQAHQSELMGNWSGNAARAFANVYEAFDTDLAKVLTAMNTLHENMTQTHARYEATEGEQTQSVNKVAGLLNK
jgi:WXG100 family type VII secretion target